MQGFVIAIDGPVASGKGTIAPLLAFKLNAFYMNTGALFRMLALLCKRQEVKVLTEEILLKMLHANKLELYDEKILLNGEDVSTQIYHADISLLSSQIAALPKVHAQVILLEQDIAKQKINDGRIVIVEGRNIGTAVFPDAAFKLFLTASVEERAKRRFSQAEKRKEKVSYEDVLADTKMRDTRDKTRSFFPLVTNPEEHGYFVLDNTGMSEEETLERILTQLRNKKLIYD